MTDALKGQCYVLSEINYHLLGGKEKGWTPMQMKWEGVSHWFLRHQDGTILDITASQFKTPPDYSLAVGRGFLTKSMCARSRSLVSRLGRNWR